MKRISIYKILVAAILFSCVPHSLFSQCCSAGGGSPIAGGASQGVLLANQMEVNLNYQYLSTKKFQNGDVPDKEYLDRYYSDYMYLRVAHGITKNLTMSIETGYYLNKTQIGLNNGLVEKNSGFGDLILFPRYDVYNYTGLMKRWEVTVGLGVKIPLGSYSDSLAQVEPFSGTTYKIRMAPAVQTTTGAHDYIFYGFVLRGFPMRNFRVFANVLYINKGWNPLGERAGDYASMGLFASKTIWESVGLTLAFKGEYIAKMQTNPELKMFGYYSYDTEATGSRKVLVMPQISYSKNSFFVFASSEFPLYQYVNGTQIASQYLVTVGFSYRFLLKKDMSPKPATTTP